ncbi:hypothetical protein BpHYR1_029059 [Brachionus plicatilis]|uniref:Uncharacterized protein n=1 Tax=Brachionus plicatilis TaxID=10195 RepID=A0A3M7Q311_BRAPC|nr:hypothetical protein BpHYR1_029059 [Brachionus plicatilis]
MKICILSTLTEFLFRLIFSISLYYWFQSQGLHYILAFLEAFEENFILISCLKRYAIFTVYLLLRTNKQQRNRTYLIFNFALKALEFVGLRFEEFNFFDAPETNSWAFSATSISYHLNRLKMQTKTIRIDTNNIDSGTAFFTYQFESISRQKIIC